MNRVNWVPQVPRIWGPGKPRTPCERKASVWPHRRWWETTNPNRPVLRTTTTLGCPIHSRTLRMGGKPQTSTALFSEQPQPLGCPRSLAFGDLGNHEPHASEKRAFGPTAGGGKQRTPTVLFSERPRPLGAPSIRALCEWVGNHKPQPPCSPNNHNPLGAPGPSHLGTWETTNPMARKRRLPHRRWWETTNLNRTGTFSLQSPIAPPSSCLSACTYSVSACRPSSVIR